MQNYDYTQTELMVSLATRDNPLTRQTDRTRHSKAKFHECYCISYPFICTVIDRSTCRMHYYCDKISLMKQKSASGIPWRNSVNPHFTNGLLYI